VAARPRDVGDRVDAERVELGDTSRLDSEHVAGGKPALLATGRGEGRRANDIAHRVDAGDACPEVLIYPDPTARIGGDTCVFEAETVRGPVASGGDQHEIRSEALAALHHDHRLAKSLQNVAHLEASPEDRRKRREGRQAFTAAALAVQHHDHLYEWADEVGNLAAGRRVRLRIQSRGSAHDGERSADVATGE